ncbi:hypothetical protein IHN59_13380, partial [Deinococcus sp. 23YEL01]|nr:hypothetical protein [Deinococcus sp. 23YEL01]
MPHSPSQPAPSQPTPSRAAPDPLHPAQALQVLCDGLSAQVLDVALNEQAEPDVRYVVTLPDLRGTRLAHAQARLDLTDFETGVLALALATELYPERMLAACAAALQMDSLYAAFLTPALTRRWLLSDEWTEGDAFSAARPLLACNLIEFGSSANASVLEALTPLRLSAGLLGRELTHGRVAVPGHGGQ